MLDAGEVCAAGPFFDVTTSVNSRQICRLQLSCMIKQLNRAREILALAQRFLSGSVKLHFEWERVLPSSWGLSGTLFSLSLPGIVANSSSWLVVDLRNLNSLFWSTTIKSCCCYLSSACRLRRNRQQRFYMPEDSNLSLTLVYPQLAWGYSFQRRFVGSVGNMRYCAH